MSRLLRPVVVADEASLAHYTLLSAIELQVRLINALTLLLTFGLVFPPLAVVICASVWSETCFAQLLMRRLLGEAEAASAATGRLYRRRLERDAEGMRRRKNLHTHITFHTAPFVSVS